MSLTFLSKCVGLFQALLIIIGPTDESQPYVSSAAASEALKRAGVAQHVLNLGDYIDTAESKDITYNGKRIYNAPYEQLSGIAGKMAADLKRGKSNKHLTLTIN